MMKKNQKLLSFFLFTIFFFFCGLLSAHEIPDEKISFNYVFGEGETFLDCKHTRLAETHDWQVQCYDNAGKLTYETTVHLILRTVKRPNSNETHIEFHFWTPDDSQSIWLTLENGQVGIKQLLTYLGVQDERAFLRLQIIF